MVCFDNKGTARVVILASHTRRYGKTAIRINRKIKCKERKEGKTH